MHGSARNVGMGRNVEVCRLENGRSILELYSQLVLLVPLRGMMGAKLDSDYSRTFVVSEFFAPFCSSRELNCYGRRGAAGTYHI